MEEPGAYVGTRASAHKHASQSGGRFYADEFGRSGAEVHGEPTASCGDLENPPSIDLEPQEAARMSVLGLTDGVPELRFEPINHRPEQSSTGPRGGLCVAAGRRGRVTG